MWWVVKVSGCEGDASTDLWMVSSQAAHSNHNMHEMSRESERHWSWCEHRSVDGVRNVYSRHEWDEEIRRCQQRSVLIMCRVVVAVLRKTVKELLTEKTEWYLWKLQRVIKFWMKWVEKLWELWSTEGATSTDLYLVSAKIAHENRETSTQVTK